MKPSTGGNATCGKLADTVETLHLPCDVYEWYLSGSDSGPLVSYNIAVKYGVFYNLDELERLLDEGKTVWRRYLLPVRQSYNTLEHEETLA